ncbi:MAG: hypothetical protein EOO24_03060 [Comamonadaceae bacterium]|nr:MAG: hypothetical protein EOO24_03060 [Comamonadaceae bacterium]
MCIDPPPLDNAQRLTASYSEDLGRRCRTVGGRVQAGRIDLAPVPARLLIDWHRETIELNPLQVGDVEPLPLARAMARWPGYRSCVNAALGWMGSFGGDAVQPDDELALMACRGARYHHDAHRYAGSAFFNVFVCEDLGLDLHFPYLDHRIPLTRGTVVLFDTGQPHGVIRRDAVGFDPAGFDDGVDRLQCFLTWELSIERSGLAAALGVNFLAVEEPAELVPDGTASDVGQPAGRLRLGPGTVEVCAESGRWQPTLPTLAPT